MSAPKEIHHIHTYKAKLCLARPGDPPILVPEGGTNCPKCRELEAEYDARTTGWQERQREHINRVVLEGVSSKKTGTR